jgi:hypothetical protein
MKVPSGRLLAAGRRVAGQADLVREAGIDPTTLSRMESAGADPVRGSTRNLQAVLDALRKHGVEIDEDSIRLVKKRR